MSAGAAGSAAAGAAADASPIRVAVFGAAGRMGREVCAGVRAAAGLELVAELDLGYDARELRATRAQVAVDFTVPDVVLDNVHAALRAGCHVVVGTTGWTPERLETVRGWLVDRPDLGVLVAPNFSLSAVLLMRFAAQAAPYFESAEVIELHHPDKVDAPSGTARHTAEAIAAARRSAGLGRMPDATSVALDGARGADVAGVRVHAVRLRGLVAHEEVLLGGPGEQLVLRQDSFQRSSFVPGVLIGVRTVAARPGLTVGLEHYLQLRG